MNHTSMDGVIRQLLPSDIPGAFALSCEAKWNQLPEDWERLITLSPAGCFGLECQDRLAATTTVVCHGADLAWIGMVLTASEFRRRGFAERLLEEALKFADARGVATIKLDATEAGISLYRKFGFSEECVLERWQRASGAVDKVAVEAYLPFPSLDTEIFGTDRGALLALLAKHCAVSLPGQGFAMGRPGFRAAYFGPCVANSADTARTLLTWFLGQQRLQKNVFWDLFPSNTQAVELARGFGFSPVRRLVRMSLTKAGSSLQPNYMKQFAISGFEFG